VISIKIIFDTQSEIRDCLLNIISISIKMLHDNLVSVILQKLSIDTIYRLYLRSSLVRKIVDKQTFWIDLIKPRGQRPPNFVYILYL